MQRGGVRALTRGEIERGRCPIRVCKFSGFWVRASIRSSSAVCCAVWCFHIAQSWGGGGEGVLLLRCAQSTDVDVFLRDVPAAAALLFRASRRHAGFCWVISATPLIRRMLTVNVLVADWTCNTIDALARALCSGMSVDVRPGYCLDFKLEHGKHRRTDVHMNAIHSQLV